VYRSVWVIVYGLCTRMHESSAAAFKELALSCREDSTEPQPSPDVAAIVLALTHHRLFVAERPPLVNHLEASSVAKEPPLGGADEWALEPLP